MFSSSDMYNQNNVNNDNWGMDSSQNVPPGGQGLEQQQQQPMETVALESPSGKVRTQPVLELPPQDLITEILTNKTLRIPKAFYLFFFAAFGSLFPLMAVYFKQLGMSPIQTGILIGIRPFIEIFSAPFWSSLADRYQKGKILLLVSLFAWIVFTCSLAFIRPPAAACVIFNATHHVMYTPYADTWDDEYEESVVEKGTSTSSSSRTFVQSSKIDSNSKNFIKDPIDSGAPADMSKMNLQNNAYKNPIDSGSTLNKNLFDNKNSIDSGAINSKNNFLIDSNGKIPIASAATDVKKKKSIFWDVDPKLRHKAPPGHVIGMSPVTVDYTLNYNKDKHASYVSPAFSTIVYKLEDVKEVFFLLLLLVLLGEFFSAPAITLADSATLAYLGDNTDLYARQRSFGSIGWAISMLVVGMALDSSTNFPGHPCGPHERERNYKVCFTYFAILMICAIAVATQFEFIYDSNLIIAGYEIPIANRNADADKPRPIFNTAPPINPPPGLDGAANRKFEFIDKWKSAVFASRSKDKITPEWLSVIKIFANVKYGLFLFVVWFMGLGIGLVFAFLFWHLQDIGGTPTLFGLASVINHLSEIIAYNYSLQLIKELGHTRVLCIGLGGNIARFIYVAILSNSWWVLPFELIQGVTHATVWAACCSYITAATEPKMRSSTQAVLQALHHGLGRGCGAIIGGYFINLMGTRITFATYGLLSAVVLTLFVAVNYTKSPLDGKYHWNEDEIEMEINLYDTALAPHGVPSAPIHKAASKTNLPAMNQDNWETTQAPPAAEPNVTYAPATDPYHDSGWGDSRGGYAY